LNEVSFAPVAPAKGWRCFAFSAKLTSDFGEVKHRRVMIQYEGKRTQDGCKVTRTEGTQMQPLPLRLDIWNHSPTGFEWGYGGSGPAQLSLALLVDALHDEEMAARLHQDFKWEVISRLPFEGWQMEQEVVIATARRLEEERNAACLSTRETEAGERLPPLPLEE
jgi:hypothetical protein